MKPLILTLPKGGGFPSEQCSEGKPVRRMKRLLSPLLGKIPALGLTSVLCVLLLAQGSTAIAQDIPPFPILYGGRALLNGDPLPEGTRLVARVRDYETWTFVERDGTYRNLLVGPPSRDYYNATVTFHVQGLRAEEQDVFRPAGEPTFRDVGFDLHFSGPPLEVSPQPSPPRTPTAGASPQPPPTPTPTDDAPPQPSPSPTPTAARSPVQPEAVESGGFSALRLAVGAGVIVAVLAGWLVLRRRWTG